MVAMAKQDYYKVLGVGRDASDAQIKNAYRKLAKRYHPDRNKSDQSAETKFKEVQEAYDVLNDKSKRRQYDQFGHVADDGVAQGQWRSGPGGTRTVHWSSGPGGGGMEFDLGDLEAMFGGMGGGGAGSIFERFARQRSAEPEPRRRRGPRGGRDIEHEVTLTFEQAIHGATLTVDLAQARSRSRDAAERIQVRIPAGVQPGQRIRVRGKGEGGPRGGARGDLYIVCHVRPHPHFKRIENDIYLDVPITIAEACLGAKVEMPTIDGTMLVTIPPGTTSGAKLRLKGKGVMNAKSTQRGDQYAVVRIVPPPSLSARQEALLAEFQEESEFNPRDALDWEASKT